MTYQPELAAEAEVASRPTSSKPTTKTIRLIGASAPERNPIPQPRASKPLDRDAYLRSCQLLQVPPNLSTERKIIKGHSLAKADGINAVYQHYSVPQLAEVIYRIYTDAPILPR